MSKVGIVMGSDSDLSVMKAAMETLEKFGIEYDVTVISAHRMPDIFFEYAKSAESKYDVLIAGAGGAAHLPGMAAAITPIPVIGVPILTKSLGGVDYSSDACRYTCCYSCHQRCKECGYTCS